MAGATLDVVFKDHLPLTYFWSIQMTQQLVTVIKHTIGTEEVNAVNARDLWKELAVGRDFSNWIKGRIDQYDFVENTDYVVAKSGERESTGFKRPIDYFITLDMAKELAMVENNPQGRKARRYFIECEKRSKALELEAKWYYDRMRRSLLLDTPHTWEKMFPDSFFDAIMKLHGQVFRGNNSTPSYCSKIINDWVGVQNNFT